MIDQIVLDICEKLKVQLPFVKSTQHIARQDPKGIILLEQPEEYAGIDDRADGKLYVRFRDGFDVMFSAARLISGKDTTTTTMLRGVFMHYCDNEIEIARFLSFGIMACENHALRYSVNLRRMSTDKQFILQQETKQPGGWPENKLRLIMVDFDVTYRDALLMEAACVPECHVC